MLPSDLKDERAALAEIVACFPVYRSYIRPDIGKIGVGDRAIILEVFAAAQP